MFYIDYSHVIDGRRPFTTSMDIVPKSQEQMQMFGGSDFENTDASATFINEIRKQAKKWRENNYTGVTRITRELRNYWFKNPERLWHLQLFFCQRDDHRANLERTVGNRLWRKSRDGTGNGLRETVV